MAAFQDSVQSSLSSSSTNGQQQNQALQSTNNEMLVDIINDCTIAIGIVSTLYVFNIEQTSSMERSSSAVVKLLVRINGIQNEDELITAIKLYKSGILIAGYNNGYIRTFFIDNDEDNINNNSNSGSKRKGEMIDFIQIHTAPVKRIDIMMIKNQIMVKFQSGSICVIDDISNLSSSVCNRYKFPQQITNSVFCDQYSDYDGCNSKSQLLNESAIVKIHASTQSSLQDYYYYENQHGDSSSTQKRQQYISMGSGPMINCSTAVQSESLSVDRVQSMVSNAVSGIFGRFSSSLAGVGGSLGIDRLSSSSGGVISNNINNNRLDQTGGSSTQRYSVKLLQSDFVLDGHDGRSIQYATQSADGRFIAMNDTMGRILIYDVKLNLIVQMIKGYRDAQIGFIQSSSSSSKSQIQLVVYVQARCQIDVFKYPFRQKLQSLRTELTNLKMVQNHKSVLFFDSQNGAMYYLRFADAG
ncbi:hypothetical protein MP228_013160 [Amoeboaphelidium protococcarum]|nr:hypothetical protein MP228_013160 [Amoeboaphelidium protococcarum]